MSLLFQHIEQMSRDKGVMRRSSSRLSKMPF